ncbi:MAG: PorT family protein [Bacteroidetes bacterium]|nr:PorT family protein [Bacteroidota bacterium]
MKKIIPLLIFMFFSTYLFAQDDEKAKFRIGLHISPQLSWMKPDVDSLSTSGIKPGFGYGVMFDVNIGANYAFSSGLTILNTGGTISFANALVYKSDTFPTGTKIHHKLQYIEIPVLIKLKTNEIGYLTYYGQFGVTPGVNIKAKADITTVGNTDDKNNIDINNEVKFLNLGLTIAGGVEYSVGGKTSLIGAIVFNNGFIDMTADKNLVILNNLILKLGIMF